MNILFERNSKKTAVLTHIQKLTQVDILFNF